MSQYFSEPLEPFGGDINVKVDLSNYATKNDLKNVTRDKCDTNYVDLSKLSNVVKNDVVKKTVYDKLVKKVNDIDTTDFVLKTPCDTNKSDLEKKISDVNKEDS